MADQITWMSEQVGLVPTGICDILAADSDLARLCKSSPTLRGSIDDHGSGISYIVADNAVTIWNHSTHTCNEELPAPTSTCLRLPDPDLVSGRKLGDADDSATRGLLVACLRSDSADILTSWTRFLARDRGIKALVCAASPSSGLVAFWLVDKGMSLSEPLQVCLSLDPGEYLTHLAPSTGGIGRKLLVSTSQGRLWGICMRRHILVDEGDEPRYWLKAELQSKRIMVSVPISLHPLDQGTDRCGEPLLVDDIARLFPRLPDGTLNLNNLARGSGDWNSLKDYTCIESIVSPSLSRDRRSLLIAIRIEKAIPLRVARVYVLRISHSATEGSEADIVDAVWLSWFTSQTISRFGGTLECAGLVAADVEGRDATMGSSGVIAYLLFSPRVGHARKDQQCLVRLSAVCFPEHHTADKSPVITYLPFSSVVVPSVLRNSLSYDRRTGGCVFLVTTGQLHGATVSFRSASSDRTAQVDLPLKKRKRNGLNTNDIHVKPKKKSCGSRENDELFLGVTTASSPVSAPSPFPHPKPARAHPPSPLPSRKVGKKELVEYDHASRSKMKIPLEQPRDYRKNDKSGEWLGGKKDAASGKLFNAVEGPHKSAEEVVVEEEVQLDPPSSLTTCHSVSGSHQSKNEFPVCVGMMNTSHAKDVVDVENEDSNIMQIVPGEEHLRLGTSGLNGLPTPSLRSGKDFTKGTLLKKRNGASEAAEGLSKARPTGASVAFSKQSKLLTEGGESKHLTSGHVESSNAVERAQTASVLQPQSLTLQNTCQVASDPASQGDYLSLKGSPRACQTSTRGKRNMADSVDSEEGSQHSDACLLTAGVSSDGTKCIAHWKKSKDGPRVTLLNGNLSIVAFSVFLGILTMLYFVPSSPITVGGNISRDESGGCLQDLSSLDTLQSPRFDVQSRVGSCTESYVPGCSGSLMLDSPAGVFFGPLTSMEFAFLTYGDHSLVDEPNATLESLQDDGQVLQWIGGDSPLAFIPSERDVNVRNKSLLGEICPNLFLRSIRALPLVRDGANRPPKTKDTELIVVKGIESSGTRLGMEDVYSKQDKVPALPRPAYLGGKALVKQAEKSPSLDGLPRSSRSFSTKGKLPIKTASAMDGGIWSNNSPNKGAQKYSQMAHEKRGGVLLGKSSSKRLREPKAGKGRISGGRFSNLKSMAMAIQEDDPPLALEAHPLNLLLILGGIFILTALLLLSSSLGRAIAFKILCAFVRLMTAIAFETIRAVLRFIGPVIIAFIRLIGPLIIAVINAFMYVWIVLTNPAIVHNERN